MVILHFHFFIDSFLVSINGRDDHRYYQITCDNILRENLGILIFCGIGYILIQVSLFYLNKKSNSYNTYIFSNFGATCLKIQQNSQVGVAIATAASKLQLPLAFLGIAIVTPASQLRRPHDCKINVYNDNFPHFFNFCHILKMGSLKYFQESDHYNYK